MGAAKQNCDNTFAFKKTAFELLKVAGLLVNATIVKRNLKYIHKVDDDALEMMIEICLEIMILNYESLEMISRNMI